MITIGTRLGEFSHKSSDRHESKEMTESIKTSANGKFSYSKVYFGKALIDIVQECHKLFSEEYKWSYKPLVKGQFGMDNMLNSIGRCLEEFSENKEDTEKLSSLIHEGWCENYIFWRDEKPAEKNRLFKNPFSPLGDERRNLLSKTPFKDLPKEEADKDRILVKCLLKVLN